MKSYLDFFLGGGTVIPDKYFIELKDFKGNPTGHKMIKNPIFIISEDVKDIMKLFRSKIKLYNDIKKNLPEVNQNTSNTFSPSIGTTISLADYWSKNPSNSLSYNLTSVSSTGL